MMVMSAAARRTAKQLLALTVCGVLLSSTEALAQPLRRALPTQALSTPVPPLLDDAGLHDVQFVGQRRGWAVGDRGVIWRTDDGGESWQRLASGVDCPLRSVCFLTDRVGWVVGGGITPHAGITRGVVLATTDGGDTWTHLGEGNLPLLYTVRFFDLDEGMAVCQATTRFPSGVLHTTDGGKTWQPLPGTAGNNWRVGDFVDADMGFVAGTLGRFTSVGGGQVMPPLTGAAGLRGIHDVALQADGRGWLAGDGGLVLTTNNGGVSWRPPDGELPRQLRDAMDFRAVAVRGDHVWLAGTPGSVVWHSADGGQSWAGYPTSHSAPLTALHFTSETEGWAVGALGTILTTHDGGRSWTPSRGGDRRAAVLAIHAHESRVSLNLVTRYGGEQAYRTAVTLMSRRDIGPDRDAGRTLDLRLHDAVLAAGGAASSVDWAFPVAAPELDHNVRELIREWQLLTDNRLREVMLSRLTVQLRTWRPDVLIVDMPPDDDATTKLLADALKLAVVSQASPGRQSGDTAPTDELASLLHLPPWQLKRAYRRLPPGSEGDVAIDAFEFLPRLGSSVAMAAANAIGILGSPVVTQAEREAYALWPLEGSAAQSPGRDFFAGLVLEPGGEARRRLGEIDDRQLEQRQNLAQQQRNFVSYTRSHLDDQRHAAQLLGQTKDIIGAAPPQQAAVQLAQLADEYRRRGQWEHAQAALFELAERYPDQPATLEGLRWLLLFTGSAEVSWQRLRETSSVERTRIRVDQNIVQANVRDAMGRAREQGGSADATDGPASPIQQAAGTGALQFGGGTSQHAARVSQWHSQAARVAELLQRQNAAYYAEPEVQFPLAALERARKRPRQADAIVTSFLSDTAAEGPWNRVAAGEVWLVQPATAAPGKVALCHRASQAPYLDGQLDDPCWQKAIRVPLRSEADHRRTGSFSEGDVAAGSYVQLAYDDRFLYVAARLPRSAGVESAPVEQPGRTDDADLRGQDRLSLQLDVDRDYATYYRIDVDQRGWTADACWDNETWNARRYIAVTGLDDRWLVEMAIPFAELVPQPPQPGETWAAGLVRILPTVGIETWSLPAGTRPMPQGFGLLRFE
jgi:photosystem II stability/assembly factor-like uncharacterized protein